MTLSYWEKNSYFSKIDYTIIGSGIVGLNTALCIKKRFPKANILIIEKGTLPQGASTKNAGFACFGSLSEIIDDLKSHTEEDVITLIRKRIKGLQLLRKTLGNKTIGYKNYGGYELFFKKEPLFETYLEQKHYINKLLKPVFKTPVFSLKENIFRFENIKNNYIFNPFEAQINTGKMMTALTKLVQKKGVKILNNIEVKQYTEEVNKVIVKTSLLEFSTKKLLITTNGFASQFLNENVKPARAQVLITKPIKNLHIKGTFHLDKGYYYFRNINNRILFGGGRHLDFKTEETTTFGETFTIQNKLESLLKTIILPNTPFEIDYKWSGIMGIGKQKKAIVKQVGNHVFCGVRLGGMGIAIGSLVGKELADLL